MKKSPVNLMTDETLNRLVHIITCQQEIISNQEELLREALNLLLQHISAEAEELAPIIKKINETAEIRAEY